MELYLKEAGDITYKSKLTPASILKFPLEILVYLTSWGFDNLYPSPKHPENLFDIFGIGFGINSQTALRAYDLCRSYRAP